MLQLTDAERENLRIWLDALRQLAEARESREGLGSGLHLARIKAAEVVVTTAAGQLGDLPERLARDALER